MKFVIGKDPLKGFTDLGGQYPVLDMLGVRSVNLLYIINHLNDETPLAWQAVINRKDEYLEAEDGTIVRLTPMAKLGIVRYDIEGPFEDTGKMSVEKAIKNPIRTAPTPNPAKTLSVRLKKKVKRGYDADRATVDIRYIMLEYGSVDVEIVDDLTSGFVVKSEEIGFFEVFKDNRITYEEALAKVVESRYV